MIHIFVFISLISLLSAFPGKQDEVIILPGLRFQPLFKHYSGYLNGSDTRKLHYWFVESEKSPSSDPLVLWLNGGPGCSSLDGFITENGPFQIVDEGYLTRNSNSWNKIANVIYLESPSCVGFSYSTDGDCSASDDSTSLLNFNALKHFLIKFPQYKNRDFYITGESYGGYYIPTLAVRIVSATTPSQQLPIRFKGIAVGNGLSSWAINNNGNFHFAYYHGLFSDSLWSEILLACCKPGQDSRHCDITGSNNAACQAKVIKAQSQYNDLNVYNIYSDCYSSSASNNAIWNRLNIQSNYEKFQIVTGWNQDPSHRISKLREQYLSLLSAANFMGFITDVKYDIPCSNDTAPTTYLNDPRVRFALHIPDNVKPWAVCNFDVNKNYKSIYLNMTNQYKQLFNLKNFKIWIYNGDVDMACSYVADEWFFESFNQQVISHRKQWYYEDPKTGHQIGGFVKLFEKFALITIRGSGHMVPTDKPIPAYHMFESFINGNSL